MLNNVYKVKTIEENNNDCHLKNICQGIDNGVKDRIDDEFIPLSEKQMLELGENDYGKKI